MIATVNCRDGTQAHGGSFDAVDSCAWTCLPPLVHTSYLNLFHSHKFEMLSIRLMRRCT